MFSPDYFTTLLSKHVKCTSVTMDDVLFGSGLNISSIRFTEFVLELEEDQNVDINIDDLEASIVTVGQLYERLKRCCQTNSDSSRQGQ